MADWHVTPTQIYKPSGDVVSSGWPIQDVLGADHWSSSGRNRERMCSPGDTIRLVDGIHRHFRVTHSRHVENRPITVVGEDQNTTFIGPNPVGGSHTLYLEKCHKHQFQDITFLGDDTAAVMTERPQRGRDEGVPEWDSLSVSDTHFRRCDVDGGFNWSDGSGPRNKWLLQSYELGKTEYPGAVGFSWDHGSFSGCYHEHAMYLHNIQGHISFTNLTVNGMGRSWAQTTNRVGDGPMGKGTLYFGDCYAWDLGLNDGSSALSFRSGHRGAIVLNRVTIKQGDASDIDPRWAENVTGCLVTHKGSDSHENAYPDLFMTQCRFHMGRHRQGLGSFRRENTHLSFLRRCKLRGNFIKSWPGAREALVIQPQTIEHLDIDESNRVIGDVVIQTDADRAVFKDPDQSGAAFGEALTYLRQLGVS